MKVTVLGSAGFDIYAISRYFKPLEEDKQKLVVLSHSSQIWLDNCIQEPGGEGLLAAITFARQGIATTLATKLGTDKLGSALQALITEENIDSHLVVTTSAHNTDTTIHLSSSSNDQTSLHYTGSFLSYSKKDLAMLAKSASMLYIATLPAEKSVCNALFKFLKSSNLEFSLNPHYLHMVPARYLSKLFSLCKILILSRDEASLYLGGYYTSSEAATILAQNGIQHIVVYDGKEGIVAATGGVLYTTSSVTQSKPYESCGAEEVFAAAYVASFCIENSVEQALTVASAQACSVMSVVGARAGILQKPAARDIIIHKEEIL